jgi:hypothetical protein
MAMALHEAGRDVDALAEFNAAHQQVLSLPRAGMGDLGDGIVNWLVCQTLHQEAARTIAPK